MAQIQNALAALELNFGLALHQMMFGSVAPAPTAAPPSLSGTTTFGTPSVEIEPQDAE